MHDNTPRPLVSLVIRPEEQAHNLALQLTHAHLATIVFPTTMIVSPPNLAKTQQQLAELDHYQGVIFCTANAVARCLLYKDDLANTLRQANTTVIAIGPATAQALTHAKIPITALPEHDYSSEGVLALLQLHTVNNQRWAVIAGEGGRTLLQQTLMDRGAHVTKLAVYARGCPPIENIALHHQNWVKAGVNCIVGSSFASVENLYRLARGEIREWLLTCYVVAVSQRMQEKLSALGFEHFIRTKSAVDADIVNALINAKLPVHPT